MAEQIFTSQMAHATLTIKNAAGQPATVDGVPAWASSDETMMQVKAAADGMSADVTTIAPGLAVRFTVTADADLGAGIKTITGVSPDYDISLNPAAEASVVDIQVGPFADLVVNPV